MAYPSAQEVFSVAEIAPRIRHLELTVEENIHPGEQIDDLAR